MDADAKEKAPSPPLLLQFYFQFDAWNLPHVSSSGPISTRPFTPAAPVQPALLLQHQRDRCLRLNGKALLPRSCPFPYKPSAPLSPARCMEMAQLEASSQVGKFFPDSLVGEHHVTIWTPTPQF